MASIAFSYGSTDISLLVRPLAGYIAALSAAPEVSTAARQAVSEAAGSAPESVDIGAFVMLVTGLLAVAGMLMAGRRGMWTLDQMNTRAKVLYARSFSVYLAATMAILAAKVLDLPVFMSYCVVASHAVSSVACVPATERACVLAAVFAVTMWASLGIVIRV